MYFGKKSFVFTVLFLFFVAGCSAGGGPRSFHSPRTSSRSNGHQNRHGKPAPSSTYGDSASPSLENLSTSSNPSSYRSSHTARRKASQLPGPHERPGLATKAGEVRYSRVERVSFIRKHPGKPWGATTMHYNNLAGVYAQIKHRVRYQPCAHCPGGYQIYCKGRNCPILTHLPVRPGIEIRIEDSAGRSLSGVNISGRTYILGAANQRYTLVVENKTMNRFEVVASVDGLDVINRSPASLENRGYIINPRDTLRIDGFRVDNRRVAAFRFGSVSQSLAAQTHGARNVGVIGVAIFAEKTLSLADEARIRESADPFPSSSQRISQ